MNISLNWLKRYIDLDLPLDRISEILTDIGLEVEGLKKVESIPGGLEGMVVGHVIQCDKHPNADKLSLTKVDIGGGEPLQIVCGAPNVASGQKVIVATVGATLYPTEGDPFKIKKGKIRGEVSEGMICAEDEIGLGSSHAGIMVLPETTEIGIQAKDHFKVDSDYVFDIGLTPNRSDAICHLGVAADLEAYLKINEPNYIPSFKDPDVSQFKIDISNSPYKVNVENEKDAPRYSGIHLTDVQVGPSPQWMKNLLTSIGVRSINNVVDITNFVLHEFGQPLHAFDAEKIQGQEVRVKNLPEGTLFKSLDEVERKLSAKDLMICDGDDNPMCIAGVFGGLNSGVTESTNHIFLESAHFSASSARTSSTLHQLRTDAAKVFEKGSDPSITVIALKRAANLLKEYAHATINSSIVDEYPNPVEKPEIHLRYKHIDRHIGTSIDKEEIHDILRALNMELTPVDDHSIIVKVPTNKADVLREVDLIEEILRIYGFNKVPIPEKLTTTINFQKHPTKNYLRNKIADYLADNGFNEMMGLSLIESKYYDEKKDLIEINNTSNVHLDIMRPDALLSGLRHVVHNHNHQQNDLKLFEFGKVYSKSDQTFEEEEFISIFMTGMSAANSWNNQVENVDFFNLKKCVNDLFSKLNIQKFQISEVDSNHFNFGLKYHRGEKVIVELGKVTRGICSKMDIDKEVYYAVFNFTELFDCVKKAKVKIDLISKYPSTYRDLAVVMDEAVTFEQIEKVVRKSEKKLIRDIQLFDVYRSEEQLGKDKKSYALRFVFQDDNKTLKDKDMDKVMKSITQNLENQVDAHIRS